MCSFDLQLTGDNDVVAVRADFSIVHNRVGLPAKATSGFRLAAAG
jgi:hypothetical protein